MKLSFLGRSYEAAAPTVETTSTEHDGRFLGQNFTLKQSHAVSPNSSQARLRYRGIDYTK